MKKTLLIATLLAILTLCFYQCKKDDNKEPTQDESPITEPNVHEPDIVEPDEEIDPEIIAMSDATEDVIESNYVVDETLHKEENSKVQILDKAVKKQIVSFGDSLYAAYFGKSLKKSLSFDVTENPEDIYIENENRNYSNGKYIVETGSCSEKRPSWGQTDFNQWVNTVAVLNADKSVDVYIIPTAGIFKNGGYLFMKLGSVNSGEPYNNECVHFKEGDPYVYFHIQNFDEFADGDPSEEESRVWVEQFAKMKRFPLTNFGYVNIFPLILSDNGNRYYAPPIYIHTKPYFDESIKASKNHTRGYHPDYGKVYGTINGVRVICDGPNNSNCYVCCKGIFQSYQCSELCARYATLVVGKSISQCNAKIFHEKPQSVLEHWQSNGQGFIAQAPQESDILEYSIGTYGHVVVVSKVDYKNKKLYYSHQNAAGSDPIMRETTFEERNGKYKINYGTSYFHYILRAKFDNPTHASDIDKEYKNTYDTPYRELELDYDLSGSKTVTYGEDLSLTINANYNCDIYLNIDGEKTKYTSESTLNTKLPTSKPGTHTVKFYGVLDNEEGETHQFTYTVTEPKTPKITVSLSSTNVKVGETVKLTVNADMDCDIKYTINGSTKSYSSPTILPTSTAGTYTVKVTATAKDGGKTANETRTYTVNEPKTPTLSASLSSTSVQEGETVKLTVSTDMDCDIKFTVNGNTYTYYNTTTLPTNTAGSYTVKVTATAKDGGKTATATKYYTVTIKPEPKTPVISASLSATTVEEGGNVRLTVSTDIDCDIKYTVNGSTYTYYSSTYLPTNSAGSYTVKVTATAKDGGKTATDTKYYTVNKKYEPIVVNLRLGNPPAVVYKGDNAKVYFSTSGISCKIEYQYGTLQKQTYSNNATEGYVPLFTTNGASDVELTVYATPLEDLQNTYSKSITYDVIYPFQVNFIEPSGNSFEVGELKYFTVHSPYYLVDASFKYYQRSDLNEYEDDFTKYYHTLYTDEPGHYKLTIRVTSRDNSDDYETYTYEYDVEEEDAAPEITFSKSTNKYIDVDDYYTLTIYTDKTCKIKVYDDDEELIKSKSDTDNLTITVPTSYKVGTHYIYVKAISESGLETEKSWKYTLEEIKIPDVKGSKIIDINYNSKNVELYPNTDAEFSAYYRGNGLYRVSKNTGYFQSGGIFFIIDAGSVENGWPISEYGMEDYVNKDGDAYYDLQIPKKRDINYYIVEIHKVSYGYTGYYIGPFTY